MTKIPPLLPLTLVLACTLLSACGGGGGSASTAVTTPSPKVAVPGVNTPKSVSVVTAN